MEFDDVEEQMETRHAVITAKIFEFSDKCIHLPGKKVKPEYLRLEKGWYHLIFYANGRTETDEGYVSITIVSTEGGSLRRGRCIISAIDAYENQRFTETFTFFMEHLNPGMLIELHHIDRYISRERLLSEPDELLPGGVLTLLINVCFVEREHDIDFQERCFFDVFNSYFQQNYKRQIQKFLLDSPLAELLIKESGFFQKMLENPMAEKGTKTMNFDMKDYTAFMYIGKILMEEERIRFYSIREIFDTYIVADRYCIPAVTGTCSAFLKLCLSHHTVDEYFEIANEYEAEGLKELLVNVINLVKQTDFKGVIEKLKDGVVLIPECLWRYHTFDEYISFHKNVKKVEKENFDFYK